MSKGLKFFLVAFFVSFLGVFALNIFQETLEDCFYAQISQPLQEISPVEIPEKPNLDLQTKSAISAKINRTGNQKILFKKNSDQPLPIASLTKLMTAVIVLEDQNYSLDNTQVLVSEKAANQENVPNHGNLDLEKGKKISIRELLDLMLVYSSNDAAWALSEVMGTENFVGKMNQKANDLGLENTHFANPNGLDPAGFKFNPENLNYFNYSTAKDLTRLAQYILKEQPLIFEISAKEAPYLVREGIFNLFLTQEVVGGKTGYTDEAGGCMIFLFQNGKGETFINLILGAQSVEARITEMQKLINWLTR
jgi:D-alanyl-D-alanine carboxypeptidase (penicillin-binding protein 5/6)